MEKRMIQYKIKKEKVIENETLIKAIFQQLKETKPIHLRYAAYKMEDGQTFIHFVSYENEAGKSLTDLPAFKDFQTNIKERFEVPPVFTDLAEIGSYNA